MEGTDGERSRRLLCGKSRQDAERTRKIRVRLAPGIRSHEDRSRLPRHVHGPGTRSLLGSHPYLGSAGLCVPVRRHLRRGQQTVAPTALHRPSSRIDPQENGPLRGLCLLQTGHRHRRRIPHRRCGEDHPGPRQTRPPKVHRQQDPHLRIEPRPRLRQRAPRSPPHVDGPIPHRQTRRAQVRHGPRDDLRVGRQSLPPPGHRANGVAHQPPSRHRHAPLVLQHPQPRPLPPRQSTLRRPRGRHDRGLLRRSLQDPQRRPRPHQRRLRTQHRPHPHAIRRRPPLRQLPRPPRPRHLPGRPIPRRHLVPRPRPGPIRPTRRRHLQLQTRRLPQQGHQQVPRRLVLTSLASLSSFSRPRRRPRAAPWRTHAHPAASVSSTSRAAADRR
mmetsp:Transcript_8966/g.22695  ORF Transcript_8966/g.22695 Transcript_8966/m.22695 type:complete len:385 (-) Transcript_8966:197-1351(-)